MAVTTSTASNPLVVNIVTDLDSDTTVETAATTAQNLFFVEVTNPNTVAVYTKFFQASSNSSISGQHYIQLYCPANTTCYTYIPVSTPIATGLEFYSSINPGALNSQTNPTEDVIVKIGLTGQ